MEKFFNTAGPIVPELHYYIPSFERIDWDEKISLSWRDYAGRRIGIWGM